MFGTFTLFAAFYITLILSTLITCSIFKENASRVTIVALAILSAIYVAGPAVEFMQGFISACQMIADYIVVYCGPAGSVLLIMAVPALMFFIPAPPRKEKNGCDSCPEGAALCLCNTYPYTQTCPICEQDFTPCYEARRCTRR